MLFCSWNCNIRFDENLEDEPERSALDVHLEKQFPVPQVLKLLFFYLDNGVACCY
uniref:Uncharacterized protein n=1 Tax=Arundo donax TaxID=35708 RepID=A0A0A9ENV1_ARUDO